MPNDWQTVSELPPLDYGELHIWRLDLGDAAGQADIDTYTQNLSPAEVERAGRCRAGTVRQQFVAARACVRVLLGNLLGLHPSRVPLALSAFGKPEIPQANAGPLFFNLAHSRDTVLIVLCRANRVGIDLEYLDRKIDALEIARHSFHPDELLQIEQIADPAARQRAFFRCWTRKEAVLKADGRGLSLALSSFQVPVLDAAESSAVLIAGGDGLPAPQTWFVSDLALHEGIAAAFAAGVPGLIFRTFSFPLNALAKS
jgi:4'-phosphopantetheinyl transferase